MLPRARRRRLWYALLLVTVLGSVWRGSRSLAPIDRVAWLADFEVLQRHMARHYANLEWMVSQRRVNLPTLVQSTKVRLQSAVVRWQAERALREFVAAFRDPHLQLARLQREPTTPRVPAPAVATSCADLGYRDRAADFTFPFEGAVGWRPLARQPFPAGTIGSLGVLRIAHFGEDGYRAVCERVGVAESERATQLRVRAALQEAIRERLEQFAAAGVSAVLVDLTGNGGGTEWAEDAARLFTTRPIQRMAPATPDPTCDRTPIWDGEAVCSSFAEPPMITVEGDRSLDRPRLRPGGRRDGVRIRGLHCPPSG